MSMLDRFFLHLQNDLSNLIRFLNNAQHYFERHNPVLEMYYDFLNGLKSILTANKKVKIAKYRVNHLRYRLNQMEKLIEENNPNNLYKGKRINHMR